MLKMHLFYTKTPEEIQEFFLLKKPNVAFKLLLSKN